MFDAPSLNRFLALGRAVVGGRRVERVASSSRTARSSFRSRTSSVHLPFEVADYVDFYSSLEHATNLGRLFRPDAEPLLPNWRHLPVGYHGRAGTIVVSGTPVVRPCGQAKAPDEGEPTFGPSRRLDFELELGFVVGVGSTARRAGSASAFRDHVFGVVLVNDWSARDIQAWEYQPLGPFLGKSFATSISGWVTPLALLEDRFVPAPAQEPEPLPYLRAAGDWALDLELEVELCGTVVSRTNARGLYWTMPQQLAHATVERRVAPDRRSPRFGHDLRRRRGTQGSLIELTRNGEQPVELGDGSSTRSSSRTATRSCCAGVPETSSSARCAARVLPAAPRLRARTGRAGTVDLALELPPEDAFEPLGDATSASRSTPGLDPFAVEEIDEVLGRDVPGRPRREGAAAEPADRCVEDGRTGFERRDRVRVPRVPRVVEVAADRDAELGDAPRRADAPAAARATPIVSARRSASGRASATRAASSTTRSVVHRALRTGSRRRR